MIKKVKGILATGGMKEVYRLSPLVCIAGFILIPDDSLRVLIFGLGIVLFATLVGHIVRKVLFPYFDLAKLADGIEDDPKASAAVICAVIFLVTSILNAFVVLLR